MQRRGLFGSRRGQEGLTLTTLLLIVLGIVVVVVLIIGFTSGFNVIFGKFKFLPGQDLEAVAQSCVVSANAGLLIDYCSFKEVDFEGEKQFVNCIDGRLQPSINAKLTSGSTKPSCTDSVKTYCGNVDAKDLDKTLVNGGTCKAQGFEVASDCAAAGGSVVSGTVCPDNRIKIESTAYKITLDSRETCCRL